MLKLLSLLVGVGLMASPSWAHTGWSQVGKPAIPSGTHGSCSVAKVGDVCVLTFTNADAAGIRSPVVHVTTASALFRFCADTGAACVASTSGRVRIWKCDAGPPATTGGIPDNDFGCADIGGANGNATLDGTAGEPGTQNQYRSSGPSWYYIEGDAQCDAGETCQVTVTGEDPGSE